MPSDLNWDMWLGQAPMTDYLQGGFGNNKNYPDSRTHYEFRWWYEYSGGKMTDWGAHHVDIATWAIGMENSGPISVEGTAEHPVPFKRRHADRQQPLQRGHRVRRHVHVPQRRRNAHPSATSENGILFEGTEGRIFVSRGALKGKPVEDLKTNPLPEDAISKLYKGKKPGNHMGTSSSAASTGLSRSRDVYTHHRAMTTCHLANIAIRLGRKLNWDPESEQIVGDAEANKWQAREQRKGYEIIV